VYEAQATDPQVRLPADEAPHCYGAEWWYYSGRLAADNGAAFGVHAAIFHVPRIALFGLSDAWIAHYAVLDDRTGTFTYGQIRDFGPAQDEFTDAGFALTSPIVQMRGGSGYDRVQAQMSDGRFAMDVTLTDERGPVLHGTNGYVPIGEGGYSFYYSRPRMAATGSLVFDGSPHAVNGELWFDRQWGRDLTDPWLRWNWFSVRLADGADIMLYEFPESGLALGTVILKTGEPQPLSQGDFTIRPQTYWTSTRTRATYPVSWIVEVRPAQLILTISANFDNQEIDARPTTLNVYWEGLCTVTGTQNGHSAEGIAYVEMANPAR